MQPSEFTPSAPGELVRLDEEGAYAFLPRRLPPELSGVEGLLRIVEAARGAVGELVGQARLITGVELVLGALARREAIYSSRMEGTQTELLDLVEHEAEADRPSGIVDPDLQEVVNDLGTIHLAEGWRTDGRQLGLPLILDLHARLLSGVRGAEKHPGAFRRGNVYIGNRALGFAGARFVPPPIEHVLPLMEDLLAMMTGTPRYGPLIDTAIAHYQFETIHPFEDGNGRLGRLLIPLHLVHADVLDRPLLYVAPYLHQHDREYRDGLLAVSQRGEWVEWIRFFLTAIQETAIDARNRVERAMSLEQRYREAMSHSRSPHAWNALTFALERLFVSAPTLEKALGVSAPTAHGLIGQLEDAGILRKATRVRGRQRWFAAEFYEQVYGS